MGRLAKKTTILFDPDEYARLKQIARHRGCSVGELIRSTLRDLYLKPDVAGRLEAACALSELAAPVGEWEEIEREILAGTTE